MKKLIVTMTLVAAAAGCCCFCTCDKPLATAVSPDGRNEIRVWTKPLSYEVVRDGKTLVAKTAIGMKVNGACLAKDAPEPTVKNSSRKGREKSPVYKKSAISLARNDAVLDFGDWALRLAARDDGVAYRFETKKQGKIRVTCENASVTIPCPKAKCWAHFTGSIGCEETVAKSLAAKDVVTKPGEAVYLPLVYEVGGTTVAVTESDVHDYPIWNLQRGAAEGEGPVTLGPAFSKWPTKQVHAANTHGWSKIEELPKGGRWVRVKETGDWLVETKGTRTFPWRTFVLADTPAKLCESDIVRALGRPAKKGRDFSWVKPGKVAWDWWNDWNLQGPHITFKPGCNTKSYEYYIDFAAKTGVEYVIFDEGWSEALNIWKFHPNVDVPHLIDYANKKGVGIILWMAWAQVYGDEAKVASHFAKLGAKGFKVDFMDRGDADVEKFLWKFAEECYKNKMLVDYHGAHRPTGMSRAYPNVLNYEGVHGLECMKFYHNEDILGNDVRVFFGRMTAGPLDYTPGAMLNFPIGQYKGNGHTPGSLGTRARQMAMMALYEAPLQMLCDSPTNYEKNEECFKFMAATPVVWADTVGLGGCPDSYAAVARKAKDGSWYAAAIADAKAHAYTLDTSFLGEGSWKAEIFRDMAASATKPETYAHEKKTIKAGDKIALDMAPGGGFVVRFTK